MRPAPWPLTPALMDRIRACAHGMRIARADGYVWVKINFKNGDPTEHADVEQGESFVTRGATMAPETT